MAGSGSNVKDVLAAAASNAPLGGPSLANFDCSDTTVGGGRDKENDDGDMFFCGGTGADMQSIFITALGQLAAPAYG